MPALEDFSQVLPIRTGSTGRAVRLLQARMGLPQTGTFSTLNATALAAWQQHVGLTADGVYGPVTNQAMTQRADSKLRELAAALGVEVEALSAVLKVETAGGGFLVNGLPKILLERHKVYAMSTPAQRATMSPDVCNAQPGGYQGGVAEWGRFALVAAVIGEPAAVACCSWGLPQIMGSNYAACESTDIGTFYARMCANEDEQITLWGRFLRNAAPGMLPALRAKDWATFAKLYNGPANVADYSAKLTAAYASS